MKKIFDDSDLVSCSIIGHYKIPPVQYFCQKQLVSLPNLSMVLDAACRFSASLEEVVFFLDIISTPLSLPNAAEPTLSCHVP